MARKRTNGIRPRGVGFGLDGVKRENSFLTNFHPIFLISFSIERNIFKIPFCPHQNSSRECEKE